MKGLWLAQHGERGSGRPCLPHVSMPCLNLAYIPKASHQGLFPIPPSEADHQTPAIKVLKSNQQKSPFDQ